MFLVELVQNLLGLSSIKIWSQATAAAAVLMSLRFCFNFHWFCSLSCRGLLLFKQIPEHKDKAKMEFMNKYPVQFFSVYSISKIKCALKAFMTTTSGLLLLFTFSNSILSLSALLKTPNPIKLKKLVKVNNNWSEFNWIWFSPSLYILSLNSLNKKKKTAPQFNYSRFTKHLIKQYSSKYWQVHLLYNLLKKIGKSHIWSTLFVSVNKNCETFCLSLVEIFQQCTCLNENNKSLTPEWSFDTQR